ncbi:MAG: tetratricopeptide repeat protein [Gemmatimonadota bacterium]|jgi:tetratricopeptide (TPR) repeat protein|nr:tetratricopeptide repeat protein [Gemmatimonadota bacterium]
MKTVLPVIALALMVLQTDPADRFTRSGDLDEAEREYRELLSGDSSNPVLNYNLGTVLLLAGRFDDARPHLEQAASDSVHRGDASYNLGNADLQPAFENPDLKDRGSLLRSSIDAYREALITNPGDEDARWNLELARRLLEEKSSSSDGGGGGGGTGEGPPNRGENNPQPSPAGGSGRDPGAEEIKAGELLGSARQQELEVQRESLRKPQTEKILP